MGPLIYWGTMGALVQRRSIKVLLLSEANELLLIYVEDPKTTSIGGEYKPFWCLVGGGIKKGESLEEAAIREIYEETGIPENDLMLAPVVWYSSFDLVRAGVPTHMEEQFIVARTKKRDIRPTGLTPWEKSVIKKMKWFSLEEIENSSEIIYPINLPKLLPDILAEKYPKKPILV